MTERYVLSDKDIHLGRQYRITDTKTNYSYKNNKEDKQKLCDKLNSLEDKVKTLKRQRKISLFRSNGIANKIHDLEEEIEQLKAREEVYEAYVDGNDFSIDWYEFCTAEECIAPDYDDCANCKMMRFHKK